MEWDKMLPSIAEWSNKLPIKLPTKLPENIANKLPESIANIAPEWLLGVGAAVVVVPSLYLCTAGLVSSKVPRLENKRICLLIAHPDDEAMFFAPAVLGLTRPETGNHVKILCLSSGDADGLGETRKRELSKSGKILGLRKPDDVFVIESPDFRDSMTATWDAGKVSKLLTTAFAPNLSKSNAANVPPTASIDVLITFDAGGVSSHPNHISLYHGAKKFVATLVRDKKDKKRDWASPVDLYTLTSVSFFRKYLGFLDSIPTFISWAVGTNKKDKKRPEGLVFLNGILGSGSYRTAWRAMVGAHKSQMVWFRYGWITLSRYMFVNDLRLERIEKVAKADRSDKADKTKKQ